MWPDTPRLLLLIVGAATLLLGAALWSLDLDKRANRAFAALLALKGCALLLYQVPFMVPDATAFVFSALPYILIPIVPVALYFASVFPRRRGWLGRPGGGWWTLGSVVALWLVYFLDHDLFWRVGPGEPAHPALVAIPGVAVYHGFGPLSLLLWLTFPVLGVLAFVFVRDYSRTASGTQRVSHFFVGTGFLVNALFDGVRQVAGLRSILGQPEGYPLAPWGWAAAFMPGLSIVPAVLALAYMAWHRFGQRDAERRLERRAYVVAAIAVLAGGLPWVLPGESGFFDHPALVFVLAMLRLALPVSVTYALVRYSLFDIDMRVRRGIGYALMASIFGGAYFLASELLEGRVADRFGDVGGLAAAAALTLVAAPLNRLTQQVAQWIMPDAVPLDIGGQAAALYSAQFAMLNEDGHLTSKERRCLDQLRERLGLTLQQARRIETA